MQWFTKYTSRISQQSVEQLTNQTLDSVDSVVTKTVQNVDQFVAPVRTSVIRRFPILFSLLTTFGVAATFFAFEKILSQYELLNRYPWLILAIGISTLAFTGTLYKKLDSPSQ